MSAPDAGRQRQRGMTAIGTLLMVGCLGFVVYLAMRLVPMYLDGFTVRSALESLKQEPAAAQWGPNEIRDRLRRRFDVNNVDSVKPSDVKVVVDDGRKTVSVAYETRVHLIANLDAVARFDFSVELGAGRTP